MLHAFNGSDGAEPTGALAQGADGNFYGATYSGGTSDYGTVFRVTTNGTLTTLFAFDYDSGVYPQGGLAAGTDGKLYGTASSGGVFDSGTVFSVTTNGTMTILLSFNNSDGSYPQCALAQGVDGKLYGTTTYGGTNGDGTVFNMTTDGTLTSLYSFQGSNGFYPHGGLLQGADGRFYGTTTQGGTHGDGTVFSITTNGTVTSLFSFNGVNGSYPNSALIQASDGNFYGTANFGGAGYDGLYWSGNGSVFRVATAFVPQPPLVVTQPASQTVSAGGTATFSVTAAGSTPLKYFWQRNGTNIAGANFPSYMTNGVQLSDSGSVFSCLVSNAFGYVASSNVTLTVVAGTPGLITFDDLIGTGLPVPAGYYGLTWSNFYYLDGVAYGEPSGFVTGVVSTNNIAYNNNGTPASIVSSSPFNFLSTYMTAAWDDNLQVEVQGYAGSVLSFDNIYALSATNPTFIALNYVGITSALFISSGGTPDFNYSGSGSGSEFAMDNVTILPTPTPPVIAPTPVPTPMPMAVLHAFEGFDGGHPSSTLTQAADGSFYGTTEYGGAYQFGTIFKMTTNGAVSTLFSFDNFNGAYPQGGLIQGTDGHLYGATTEGGAFAKGTVFSVTTQRRAGHVATLQWFQWRLSLRSADAGARRIILRHNKRRRGFQRRHGI